MSQVWGDPVIKYECQFIIQCCVKPAQRKKYSADEQQEDIRTRMGKEERCWVQKRDDIIAQLREQREVEKNRVWAHKCKRVCLTETQTSFVQASTEERDEATAAVDQRNLAGASAMHTMVQAVQMLRHSLVHGSNYTLIGFV
ncbi:hypothetical protein CBL_03991 [Carabus blaptoides fortunei]